MTDQPYALLMYKSCSCEKEERQDYDDEVKGRYSCISDRGGKMDRSGERRNTMQGMQ